MRETKFRAWDKENKEMTTTFDISSQGVITKNFVGQARITINHYILMQYTGLKDKNGKEIYCSDILRHYKYKSKSIIEWSLFGWGMKVKTKKGIRVYGISQQSRQDEWDCDKTGAYKLDNFEIIGNIYENPELITNK